MSLRRTNSSSLIAQTKQHLLAESPLPSPSLPSIVPRHGKKDVRSLTKKILRLLFWLTGVTVLLWGTGGLLRTGRPAAISYLSSDGGSYEIVGEDDLPDTPTPVMVTDRRGRSKWTMSIPPSLNFPLRPTDYQNMYDLSDKVAQHVRDTKSNAISHSGHFGYYRVDPNYMDVEDAEEHNLLPGLSKTLGHDISMSMLGSSQDSTSKQEIETANSNIPICSKSLTFLLETSNAGMGATLLALWLSYGLAQRENRAFFLDDTNWPYGSYTTYFRAPPTPSCRPPPKTQRIPCPHYAKHLIVSAATTTYTFGHAFNEEFEDPKKMGVERQRPIFEMMRRGYDALFEISGEDGTFVATRVGELNDTIRAKGGIEVGMHIRHGDRHPLEFQYQKSYIPLANYVEAARDLIFERFEKSGHDGQEDTDAEMASRFVVASDDPEVYDAEEIKRGGVRAQGRISLASKSKLEAGANAKNGKLSETLGWEGGFFTSVFWSLGLGPQIPKIEGAPVPSRRRETGQSSPADIVSRNDLATREEDLHAHPSPQSLQLRELVGRAYMLDLAILGQADRVVCTVSSAGCRILAVMMGWEKAMEKGWWRNVDGDFEWKGVVW